MKSTLIAFLLLFLSSLSSPLSAQESIQGDKNNPQAHAAQAEIIPGQATQEELARKKSLNPRIDALEEKLQSLLKDAQNLSSTLKETAILLFPGNALGEQTEQPKLKGAKGVVFDPFYPNYTVIYGSSSLSDEIRQDHEAHFQFSFQFQLSRTSPMSLHMAYTQKSIWQLYNKEDSRPFRETNYQPELFLRWPITKAFDLEFGVVHQSNGARIETSRSWDRASLAWTYENDWVKYRHRFWRRFKEDPKVDEFDTQGDENPDILDYYGNQEALIIFSSGDYQFGLLERYNPATKRGAGEIFYAAPFPAALETDIKMLVYYFNGYGETLIDYNKTLTKLGIGLMFNM